MRRTFIAPFLLVACLSCQKQAPPEVADPVAVNPPTPMTPPEPPVPEVASAESSLEDSQIAHVLHTSNEAEVADGREASTKATHPAVQQLAQQMVTDHGAADEKLGALLATKGWTPQTNPKSEKMQSEHAMAKAELAGMQGDAFDQAYVDLQVEMHQQVLDTIDQELLPNADDPELKAFIAEVRPTIAAHLDHARMLQQQLAPMR